MSLVWELKEVEDWKTLCYVDDGEGKEVLNPITNMLIWASLLVGIDKITPKNAKEFWYRMLSWQTLTGSGWLEDGNGNVIEVTMEMIEAHMGLKTNASTLDKRKFNSKLISILEETVQKRAKEITKSLESQEVAV